jgi:hypothetical protein
MKIRRRIQHNTEDGQNPRKAKIAGPCSGGRERCSRVKPGTTIAPQVLVDNPKFLMYSNLGAIVLRAFALRGPGTGLKRVIGPSTTANPFYRGADIIDHELRWKEYVQQGQHRAWRAATALRSVVALAVEHASTVRMTHFGTTPIYDTSVP